MQTSIVDLFCGAGGLSHGFILEGLSVSAGIDMDPACRFPFEENNQAIFIEQDIRKISVKELKSLFGDAEIKILAGCAPCQPFSSYSSKYSQNGDSRRGLLNEFARLLKGIKPDIIAMENVPNIKKQSIFDNFINLLNRLKYDIWYNVVDSSDYGVPQKRKRLILLASKYGQINFIEPTHNKPKTVRQAIGKLKSLNAGETSCDDRMHVSAKLTEKNYQRIKVSRPGGTWHDWPEHLLAPRHHRNIGSNYYINTYRRMEWDKPAPTITTYCYGISKGRNGHPEQDRAITLREAAILQSFPKSYKFLPKDKPVRITVMGRLIGNAVPVELGRAIARSINNHLADVGVI